jgi:hypothetical protein
MSENVYALWKRRFPILKALRGHVADCQDIVLATAVLKNMALLWNDENLVGHVGRDPREEDNAAFCADNEGKAPEGPASTQNAKLKDPVTRFFTSIK